MVNLDRPDLSLDPQGIPIAGSHGDGYQTARATCECLLRELNGKAGVGRFGIIRVCEAYIRPWEPLIDLPGRVAVHQHLDRTDPGGVEHPAGYTFEAA